jgi:hypothetical protein
MYVGGLFNNVQQHTNIDHNNHVNPGLATVQFKICLEFCDEYFPHYNFVNIRKMLQYSCGNLSFRSKDMAITLLYLNFNNNFAI